MKEHYKAQLEAMKKPYKIYTDLVEDKAAEQFVACMRMEGCIQGALMPDCHAGYASPIGGVFLFKGQVVPAITGYDIGCGVSSITFDNIVTSELTKDQLIHIKQQILRAVPIGFNRHKSKQKISSSVTSLPMTSFASDILLNTGQYQLGTLGGGNHFLEFGTTNSGNLAIVVHSGSRGVGHKIATHYMKEAAIQNTDEQRYIDEFDNLPKNLVWALHAAKAGSLLKYEAARKEFVYRRVRARVDNIEDAYPLDTSSTIGKQYIDDMNMALEFALANRKQMIDKCVDIVTTTLNITIATSRFINRNHNHAVLSNNRWIHRKGATHAESGMLGVIPGNMVDGSFVVRGLGHPDSMSSSSHGAGRVLSRRKAKDTLDLTTFRESTAHLVANHSDSNLDESPLAYKNIEEVMELQSELVEVLDCIIPILNIKG